MAATRGKVIWTEGRRIADIQDSYLGIPEDNRNTMKMQEGKPQPHTSRRKDKTIQVSL